MDQSDKYLSWTVSQLQAELKKRGAVIKGKKNDLIKRLFFYDENDNFRLSDATCIDNNPDPEFWCPSDRDYRDVNASTSMPIVTESQIRLFLDRFNVSKDLGKALYENAYLLCVRIAKRLGNEKIPSPLHNGTQQLRIIG